MTSFDREYMQTPIHRRFTPNRDRLIATLHGELARMTIPAQFEREIVSRVEGIFAPLLDFADLSAMAERGRLDQNRLPDGMAARARHDPELAACLHLISDLLGQLKARGVDTELHQDTFASEPRPVADIMANTIAEALDGD